MYSTVKDFNQSSTVVPRTCPVRSGADSDIGVIYRPDFLPIRGGGQASLFLGSLEGWGGGSVQWWGRGHAGGHPPYTALHFNERYRYWY